MLRIFQPIFFALVLCYSSLLFAQEDAQIYADAVQLMESDEFEMALDAFSYIPDYEDTNYRSVICALLSFKYRNTPIDKLLAFKDTPESDELFNYWLGRVQLRRFQLAEAEESFNMFLNDIHYSKGSEFYKSDAETKLLLIQGASEKMVIAPLESPINSRYADLPGAFMSGGDQLIFMSDRNGQGSFEVYKTDKGSYGWNAPEVISPTKIPSEFLNVLNVKESLVFLDPDNKHLQKVDVTGGSWNVHEDLDLAFLQDAHHIYMNRYGNRVIFSKKVDGGHLDLYESYKLRSTGEWMDPTPIPGQVNGTYDEDYPFLTEDRSRLYFSSNRPGGLGKCDIYYVEMDPDTNLWDKPINAGLPVNSVDDDISFSISSDNKTGLISSNRIYSSGDLDLFVVEVKD
ncbi:MAG: hypothetical protein CMB80_04255 [Flammeovirgaceae bacterium]|nr:hypothetical protein [Flammeovirgaceae bacterium]MBE60768.1 hypothetical protein [Flammeovirgaceae bacterium]